VITDLVAVHVILPDQLHRFRENRDLRISAVVIGVGGSRVMEAQAEQQIENEQTNDRANEQATSHEMDFKCDRLRLSLIPEILPMTLRVFSRTAHIAPALNMTSQSSASNILP
jgi:hypothetical protein